MRARLASLLLLSGFSAAQAWQAYQAGDYALAQKLWSIEEASAPDSAPAELCFNRALAAYRAQDYVDAKAASERAAQRGALDFDVRRDFLSGLIGMRRSETLAQQAAAPEAEPFAWEVALAEARRASRAFEQAAERPLERARALRNYERSLRWLQELERRRAEAEAEREKSPQIANQPKEQSVEPNGQEGTKEDTAEVAQTEAQMASADGLSVEQLLELLQVKEGERQRSRLNARTRVRPQVERDW